MTGDTSQDLHLWKLRMWMMNAITLMFAVAFNSTSSVLSQYAVLEFDATPIQVGILWASFFIISIFTRPISGIASDSGYRFRLLILGASMFTMSSAIYLFASNFGYLIIARLFQGLSQGIFTTSAFSFVAYEASIHMEYFEESLAWRSAMFGLGTIIGPALGGYIISFYGFTQAFAIVTVIGIIVIFAVWTMAKITKTDESLLIFNYKRNKVKVRVKNNRPSLISKTKEVFNLPSFRKAVISLFLYNVGYISITSFLPAFYATRFGKDSGIIIGNCLAIIGVSSLIPRIMSGKLSKRLSSYKIAVFGLLMLSISLFFLGLLSLPPYVYVVSIIIGIGLGFVIPSLQILALADVKSSEKGMATGLYILGFDSANLMAPIIFGTIGNVYGYELVLQTTFIPVTIAFIYLIIARR